MNKKILSGCVCLLLSTHSHAEYENNDIYNAQLSFGWAPIVTIAAGPTWGEVGESQTIFYTDIYNNTLFSHYDANKSYNLGASGNVFFALQKLIYPGIMAQFGIEVGGTSSFDLRGRITPLKRTTPSDVSEVHDAYEYHYKFSHSEIGLQAKFIAVNPGFIQPYITGSAAAAFNHAHAFSFTRLTNDPPFTPWYEKGTVTGAFAYSLGAGIQTSFYRYWQFGIGYQFADLGKSDLGAPLNNPLYVNEVGLHTTHAYTHQLQFSLSYLWDSIN